MLRIAVVTNSRKDAVDYITTKYDGRISNFSMSRGVCYLANHDELHICDSNSHIDAYRGMEFDAVMIVPGYQSLLDVIYSRIRWRRG